MTPERWHRIEQIYHAAMERAANERTLFLEQACAGDEELRREIVSLIASDNQAASFMDEPVLEADTRMLAFAQAALPSQSPIGSKIGSVLTEEASPYQETKTET